MKLEVFVILEIISYRVVSIFDFSEQNISLRIQKCVYNCYWFSVRLCNFTFWYDVSLYAFSFLLPAHFSARKHMEKGRSTINQFIEQSRGYLSHMHSR